MAACGEVDPIPQRIWEHVRVHAKQGDVGDVIRSIDAYCHEHERRASNVGDIKGQILDRLLLECSPKRVLELGAYAGYSALRIARLLEGDGKLYSVEFDPANAEISRAVIAFAGMQDRVEILEGDSGEVLASISSKTGVTSFDLVFIDHAKDLYKRDLVAMQELGLLHEGSVVVADNVIFPGCPDYLEYVRAHPDFECTNFPSKLEYSDRMDAIEKSVYRPQNKQQSDK